MEALGILVVPFQAPGTLVTAFGASLPNFCIMATTKTSCKTRASPSISFSLEPLSAPATSRNTEATSLIGVLYFANQFTGKALPGSLVLSYPLNLIAAIC